MRTLFVALAGLVALCTGSALADQDPGLIEGKAVYDYLCSRCHADGQGGAPVVGQVEDWQDRVGYRRELLVKHASEGYLGMPAGGGEARLDEAAIASAVNYMLYQSIASDE
ncbi:MAG: c-type cytochrome [Halieaceae bacterium]|jgi:cytochrome c5|nr:c-type cytochrome [Halieaceae bacterium]